MGQNVNWLPGIKLPGLVDALISGLGFDLLVKFSAEAGFAGMVQGCVLELPTVELPTDPVRGTLLLGSGPRVWGPRHRLETLRFAILDLISDQWWASRLSPRSWKLAHWYLTIRR
mmetsp:Transcript_26549/g.41560  ORF Transcript_26549/g.41560 Transcript_26549/m.41560 type:complete len:115 (-) Transcript_26549:208-552(-)